MKKMYSLATALLAGLLLSGCNWTLINPSGYVAEQQSNLMIFSVIVMLLIIIPVSFLVLYYAWKYRASNTNAEYDDEFYHSNKLEVAIWGIPIATIIVLGLITWGSTYLLDPYRPLARIDSTTRIAGMEEDLGLIKRLTVKVIDPDREDLKVVDVEPLVIQATALDWKWLFIYPEQGIATVNEIAIPVNRPVIFKLTASSMMNSFFVPAMSGQLYAMPGMQTTLHAIINKEGEYKGFGSNYTGPGFSQMYFYLHGLSNEGFDEWVNKVRSSETPLDRNEYMELDQWDQPNARGFYTYFGIRHYGSVQEGLYNEILNLCVRPGSMCMNEMMAIDLAGGGGIDSLDNYKRLQYDRRHSLRAQLDLAQFSGILPNELVCTTETINGDLAQSERPANLQSKAPTSANNTLIETLSLNTATNSSTL